MHVIFYEKDQNHRIDVIDGCKLQPSQMALAIERTKWKKKDNQTISLMYYAIEKN